MTFKRLIYSLMIALGCISVSTSVSANILNISVNTQMGTMFEIAIKNFGIAYESYNAGVYNFTSNVNITTQGARISYHNHPMGQDAWYLALDGGQLKATATTYSLFTGAQTGSGTTTGSYLGAAYGYHWFYWKTLNLNLGLVYISASMSSLTTYNNAGAAVQTVSIPSFSGLGAELGLGISF